MPDTAPVYEPPARQWEPFGPWLCNAGRGPDGGQCPGEVVLQWPYPDPIEDDPGRTVPVFGCEPHAWM